MKQKLDKELVLAVRNGDILAFEALVVRYQRGLLAFVYRILRDEQTAQEVVQDAFFRLYTAIDKVDVSKKLSTYLFEIAKNAAISALRKRKDTLPLDAERFIEDDETRYEQMVRDERASDVRQAVAKLPDKYRKAISLYYFQDLSYEEVGKKLSLPINTVRTHLKRAKALLKQYFTYEKD